MLIPIIKPKFEYLTFLMIYLCHLGYLSLLDDYPSQMHVNTCN
jgi:hypothetical protein